MKTKQKSSLDFSLSSVFAYVVVLLGATACVSNQAFEPSSRIRHDNLNASLELIVRSTAYSLPGGIRESSENRRVFKSRHVDLNGKKWDILSRTRNRAYAEIAILGDRRPYSVEFDVIVEERGSTDPLDQDFQPVGHSKPLSLRIYQKFMNYLENRRKKRNLIDEFRAF